MSEAIPDNNQSTSDMNLNKGHLETPDTAERILALKYKVLLKEEVAEIAKRQTEKSMLDDANQKFNGVFENSLKQLTEWSTALTADRDRENGEYNNALAARNRLIEKKPGSIVRRVEWTASERFEYVFLLGGAILLWLVGYLSMVQVIKGAQAASGESALTSLAVWLLPLAGVTVLALMIKTLLSTLQGTKMFKTVLWICIIAGLIASLTWLFEFSAFVGEATAPVATMEMDAAGSQVAETTSSKGESMLYIIVSILGEALGAGACWAYASSIASAKTVRSSEDNPEWLAADEKAKRHHSEAESLDEKLITAQGLISWIKAKKQDFQGECERVYRQNQDARITQEEKEVSG